MYASTLRDRTVVTQTEGRKVGHVVAVLFDPRCREVLGFRIQHEKRGESKHAEVFLWNALRKIEQDRITVLSSSELRSADRYVPLAQAVAFEVLIVTKVASQEGAFFGTIHDVELDEEAHGVRAFLINAATKGQKDQAAIQITVDHVVHIHPGGTMILDQAGAAQMLGTENHHG